MPSVDFLDEEFWWLGELGLPVQCQVGVALSRWTPPTEDPPIQLIPGQLDIGNLCSWAAGYQWANVHRTLEVAGIPGTTNAVMGPIVIDVDADDVLFDREGKPSNELVALTKNLTQRVLHHLNGLGIPEHHRRVYFSGHKGFHVHYVLPSKPHMHERHAHDYVGVRQDSWRNELRKLRNALGEGEQSRVSIDNVHHYVRLRTSINLWGPSASQRLYRVIRALEHDLPSAIIDDLWEWSAVGGG